MSKNKSDHVKLDPSDIPKTAGDAKNTEPTSLHTSLPLTAIAILSIIGAALASVSLYEHTAQLHNIEVAVPLCTLNETFNCAKVNSSPFSMLLGLPVAAWGLSYFLAQLTLSIAAQTGPGIARNLLAGLTTFGTIFCAYLFLTSVFAIHAVCPLCLGVYVVTAASLILSILANRPHSFFSGVKASFATIRRLLPGATPMALGHRQGILITLFIGLIGLMAPDFLLVKLIAPAAESKQRVEAEQQSLNTWRATEQTEQDLITETGAAQDFGYGEVTAPVQIVEFSDYQCPFCRRLAGELEELVHDFPGKLRVTVRNFPLSSECNPQMPQPVHALACAAASFARCAGEQGQFARAATWLNEFPEMEESSTTLASFESSLSGAINTLALDGSAISECRAALRTKEKIAADAQKAVELGLQGTPLVFINGKKLDYPNKTVLKQIIIELLTTPSAPTKN